MLHTFLAYFNCIVLLIISGFHFYWAFGGKFGGDAALPEFEGGEKVFFPTKIQTVSVAFIFLVMGSLYVFYLKLIPSLIEIEYINTGLLILGIIFGIRAIGDFNYVGFFKKKNTSKFAKNDLYFYSPLCLIISLSNLYLFF